MDLNATYITFFAISGFSLLCVLFVICTIKKFGSASISSRLISYMHITLLLENISTLPYVYTGNGPICQIMGFLRYYSGLSNIVVIGLMVQTYKFLFLDDVYRISPRIDKYAEYAVFAFPLITVLPFCMNMYQTNDVTWCIEPLDTDYQYLWFWVAFYFWSTLIILYSTFSLINTVYTVYNTDKVLGRKLIKTVGLYVVISLIVWVFLTISSFDLINNVWDFLIVDISGIVYFLIFLTEKKALKLLEFQTNSTANLNTTTESLYGRSTIQTSLDDSQRSSQPNDKFFSWELDDEVRSQRSHSMTSRTRSESSSNRQSAWRITMNSTVRSSTSNVRTSVNPIQSQSIVSIDSGSVGNNL